VGDVAKRREALQESMTLHAGVVRDATTLAQAQDQLGDPEPAGDRSAWELHNLVTVASALIAAATAREESRGCHARTDFPDRRPAFQRRMVLR
jgi:L-aspartate oxidase